MSNLQDLDAIFFDLDGTLIDFHVAETRSILRIMADRGVDPTESHAMRYRMINKAYWDAYGRGEIPKNVLLTRRFEVFFAEMGYPLTGGTAEAAAIDIAYQLLLGENTVLTDGAFELVRDLHGRLPLLIATNGVYRTAIHKLETAGLRSYFPLIAASETIGEQKPDRAFFDAALRMCGCGDAARVLMVGDLWDADIAGASAAGLRTCWYNPYGEARPTGKSPAPDLEIRKIAELRNWLGL
jgi:2-haloacid dehalogenase